MGMCGWCGKSLQCLPGASSGAACPDDCLNGWIFKSYTCNSQKLFGRMTNVAPDSKGFVKAEIADGKYKVRLHTQGKVHGSDLDKLVDVGTNRVVEVTHVFDGGQGRRQVLDQSEALKGRLETNMYVPGQVKEKYYDLEGNVITGDIERVFHGTEDKQPALNAARRMRRR